MLAIRSYKEISENIEKIKKLNTRFVTNFFLNETKINQWIEDESLFTVEKGKVIFIFRKHTDFFYLYYISTDLSELFIELNNLEFPEHLDFVADIVGKADETNQISNGFQSQGFIHHETLKRMFMMKTNTVDEKDLSSEIEFATQADAKPVFDFLTQRLDKYSEQIPSIKEIQFAIDNQTLLISKNNNEIAGLLYFEKIGFTAHLKEWLVNENYRENKIGSKLIKTFFYLCNNCNRFILWVKENNDNAISKYEHYGYKKESLKDTIMVKHN